LPGRVRRNALYTYSLSHMTLHFFTIHSGQEGFTLLTPPCPPANSGLLHCAYQQWQRGMFRG
jgi:hypothetical protein